MMTEEVILWTAIVGLLVFALVVEAAVEFHWTKRHHLHVGMLSEDQLLYCPGDRKEGSDDDY